MNDFPFIVVEERLDRPDHWEDVSFWRDEASARTYIDALDNNNRKRTLYERKV